MNAMRKVLSVAFIAVAVLLVFCGRAFSMKVVANNANAEADLQISLNAPSNVQLRIGGKGKVVDTVNFRVTSTPEVQPIVRGDSSPIVEVRTNSVSGVVLTADSSVAMTSVLGSMPFSVISFSGTGDLTGASGKFDGTSNQVIKNFGVRGKWEGALQFTYRNTYDYSPGSYQGTVTFTATVP